MDSCPGKEIIRAQRTGKKPSNKSVLTAIVPSRTVKPAWPYLLEEDSERHRYSWAWLPAERQISVPLRELKKHKLWKIIQREMKGWVTSSDSLQVQRSLYIQASIPTPQTQTCGGHRCGSALLAPAKVGTIKTCLFWWKKKRKEKKDRPGKKHFFFHKKIHSFHLTWPSSMVAHYNTELS